MYDAQSLLDNTLGSLDLSPRLETKGFQSGNHVGTLSCFSYKDGEI